MFIPAWTAGAVKAAVEVAAEEEEPAGPPGPATPEIPAIKV
jgi:hypothetical protein